MDALQKGRQLAKERRKKTGAWIEIAKKYLIEDEFDPRERPEGNYKQQEWRRHYHKRTADRMIIDNGISQLEVDNVVKEAMKEIEAN